MYQINQTNIYEAPLVITEELILEEGVLNTSPSGSTEQYSQSDWEGGDGWSKF